MSRALATLAVWVALQAVHGTAAAATVREAIDGLAWNVALTDEKREELIATLVTAQAVGEIEKFVASQERVAKATDGEELEHLVEALKRMGTPRAIAALRAISFSSRFVVDDVALWEVLAARLKSGAEPSGSAMARELWRLLPSDVKENLSAQKSGDLSDGLKRRVVHGLNRAVRAKRLFESRASSGGLGAEGERLLENHRQNLEPKIGNMPLLGFEMERLNRLLIEEELGGALTRLPSIDASCARPGLVALGLKVLGSIDNPSAQEIAVAEQPTTFYAMRAHMDVLEKAADVGAAVALVPYLLDRNTTLAERARAALLKRDESDAPVIEAEMLNLAIGLNPVENKDLSERTCQAIVSICASLPAERASRLMTHLLDSPLPRIVDATFASLLSKPANVNEEVVSRLQSMAHASSDKALAMRILGILHKSKAPAGVAIAEYYLRHENGAVQGMAASVLNVLTGRGIDRPSEWRRQIAFNPDVLRSDGEIALPPAVAAPAAPAASEGTSLVWYVASGAVLIVLLGVIIRRRS